MSVTELVRRRTPVPVPAAVVAALGSVAALLATYWDDAWHTDVGRDDALIPPHLLLYGGVAAAGLAIAAWGLLALRQAGGGRAGVREVLRDPALLLAGIGGTATLASGAVDGVWHALFGRDAVIWSPPHLAAVAGTLALSVGLLAGLSRSTARHAPALRVLAAAGVVGALQVPLLEYDSDVPQFATVWYLPVAALVVCLTVALLDDLAPRRWEGAAAAAVYTALRAAGMLGLLAAGFSVAVVPPVALLLLLDGALRPRPLVQRLVAVGAATPLVWWPALELQSSVATTVPLDEALMAVPLGAAAGLLVAVAAGRVRLRPLAPAPAVLLLVVAALAWSPPVARAHDPGQGEAVRDVVVAVERAGDSAAITATWDGPCDLEPVRTVARRAGQERVGTLQAGDGGDGCTLSGAVDGLTPGRWFVYAEASSGDRPVEVWLPARDGDEETETRALYAPPTTEPTGLRNAAGAVLLAVVAGLLVACLRLARRTRLLAGAP